MRSALVFLCLGVSTLSLRATTLLQLSLDDMITKSTAIVRAHVEGSYSAIAGQVIYTHYTVQVTESLKGSTGSQMDVAILGGAAKGLRQIFPGAPTLLSGEDCVLFLWTSPSGLTQIIGLSQGLFTVEETSGEVMVTRSPTQELMLNRAGKPVHDKAVQMPLSNLRAHIWRTLAGGATTGGAAK